MTNKSYEILSGEMLVAVWQDSKLTVVNEALLPLYLKKIQITKGVMNEHI